MRRLNPFIVIVPLFLLALPALAKNGPGSAPAARTGPGAAAAAGNKEQGKKEHGAYLVEHVAMCIQCHTPRDEEGNLLRSRLLSGAPVPLVSPYPDRPWALEAPPIAGLREYSDAEALRLLTTGISRTGRRLQPPMPPFRLTREDARDVIAFLRSLGPGSGRME